MNQGVQNTKIKKMKQGLSLAKNVLKMRRKPMHLEG